LAENSPGFSVEYIDGNFTEWVQEANTSTSGGLSLEHDIQKVTIDIAIRNLPALQKAYKVMTVGECSKQASYKEANTTAPVNVTTSSAVSPSVSSTPEVILTPIAAADAPAPASGASGASVVLYSRLLLWFAVIATLA
ncbi:hypothetical protein CU098_007341, partial [Rhizopus stolonifer]